MSEGGTDHSRAFLARTLLQNADLLILDESLGWIQSLCRLPLKRGETADPVLRQ
jgi:ABC-type nitrate/sulfonate/bicarbonate transport system ATPase subunit